jgi:endonuclease/exonuclease/phosphatase family metal-dependent hydrolase
MQRLHLVLGAITIAVAGCQPGGSSQPPFAELRCKAGNALDAIKTPNPTVAFINDTSRAIPAWREAVGAPVVDRTTRKCDEARLDSILVVSWNTHLGHADVRAFVADLRGGRVVEGQRINHFIILMQEAFREGESVPSKFPANGCTKRMGGGVRDIEDIADSLGLALFYVPSMRNGCASEPREDRGNAILSTLPLADLKAVELPLARQRRVAAMATVSGNTNDGREWNLVVASVHLENRSRGAPRNWVHGRAQQAEAFVAHLPDSVLLAVGGDLNTLSGSDEPAVRIIGSKFANSPEHQSENTYLSYVVVRSQLDYLFFRCHGHHKSKYWRAANRYGSDHYPVMGFIRLG